MTLAKGNECQVFLLHRQTTRMTCFSFQLNFIHVRSVGDLFGGLLHTTAVQNPKARSLCKIMSQCGQDFDSMSCSTFPFRCRRKAVWIEAVVYSTRNGPWNDVTEILAIFVYVCHHLTHLRHQERDQHDLLIIFIMRDFICYLQASDRRTQQHLLIIKLWSFLVHLFRCHRLLTFRLAILLLTILEYTSKVEVFTQFRSLQTEVSNK